MRTKIQLLRIFSTLLPLIILISALGVTGCDELSNKPEEQNHPPTVIIDNGPTEPASNTSTVTFIWHGIDEDGGISGYYYDVDNSNPGNWTTSTSKNYSDLSIGNHVFYVVAQDNDEAKSSPASWPFSVVEQSDEQVTIELSATSLDFGNVTVGQYLDKFLIISNASSSTTTLAGSVSMSGTGFSITSGDGAFSLTPGQSKTVTVRFSPSSSSGNKNGTLSITHNGANTSSPISVPLSGYAQDQAETIDISVNPQSIDFGTVATAQSLDTTVSITNSASSTADLTGSVNITGIGYSILSGSGSYGLSPGQSKTVTVRFSPSSAIAYDGTLTVTHNATNTSSPVTISLAGTGEIYSINNIAIVNPDYYRIVKFGYLMRVCPATTYYSLAYATVDDAGYEPSSWHGVGEQQDFIGTVLGEAGYTVDYFTQGGFSAADISMYDLVIVQDPLDSNFKAFDKSVETTLPDLLEKTTSQSFNDKLRNYFNNGGKIILVGDAVQLLENGNTAGKYTLGFGKTINVDEVSNTQGGPSSCVPAKWLFIRGNPFCGRDRAGSGTYTIESSTLLAAGLKLSDISLFNGNDLPRAVTWSNTVYYPSDGVSLLNVRVQGSGAYVLTGSTCSPPEYTVTVDDVLSHFMGYTEYDGKRIYYIGSDTFFDYDFIDNAGAWHAGEYIEMKHTTTELGKQAIVKLVEYMSN